MDLNKFASEKMKELRIRNNMTQKQLAQELNVTQQQIARYENNKRKFKQDLLFKLAKYFNVSIDSFFPNKEEEDLKYILTKKGLMNENGEINKRDFEKLIQIIDQVNSLKTDNKKE